MIVHPNHCRVMAASKCFGGCRDLAPMEECGRGPCSRGRHSLLMQHSISKAHSALQHARADRGAQRIRAAQHTPEQHRIAQRPGTQSRQRCTDKICVQFSLVGPGCLDPAPPTGVWRHPSLRRLRGLGPPRRVCLWPLWPWLPFLVDAAQHTAQCGTLEPTEAHNGTEPHNTRQSSTRHRNA